VTTAFLGAKQEGLAIVNFSVKVLPWDPFATFNVAVLIHSFVHIGCAFGTTILSLYS
jgi:hypothetical protein